MSSFHPLTCTTSPSSPIRLTHGRTDRSTEEQQPAQITQPDERYRALHSEPNRQAERVGAARRG